ncbi:MULTISPECIES: response regulator [unclassified Pseudomonas]|uniref:response regulator n=1 Tax=unclassified Pseudomonas TaxID=196821 RepID=UPI000BD0A64C|nr:MULTISPECIES: response regulator [unclassified Pseudomonas]PVZ13777.1 response regulator receiver domain-containing protein [Pseudomonas sp. URIL14HWK12:I12]PVZ24083.1 response regulator receiver domain-containing protein [Pseudomonas sp. URIL14HWK12:I10]PVZ33278.1 response regulator receiver domain-containing protein [Pseudomonas sp. URIL14HWK12:I11]SNZ10978.1 Response regulator containing CheY-like receiver, AAA-type ATPase, and DNA-binding domains [Pseudomonas sp. URIL14HWK12:I9]
MVEHSQPPHVLVVEDEILLNTVLCEAFREEGFKVSGVNDANEALQLLKACSGKVDLLVTDVRMPGELDGLELGWFVAELWPAVPVLTVSGYTGDARRRPVGPFLAKPFAIESLMFNANRLMARGTDWRE